MEPVITQSEDPTVADILQIFKRRKWSLVLPALLILLVTAAVALTLSPVYRSTATILIEEQEIPAEFVRTTVTSFAAERIQMIKQRITSFSRLNELINHYQLYPERRAAWTAEQIVAKMRNDIRVQPVSMEVQDPRTGRSATATIAFTLAYEGKNPETVLQVANTLTSLFLSENQQVRERQTAETSMFLEVEMNRVKKELAALDSQIATFKEAHMNQLPELLQTNLEGKARTEREIDRLRDQIHSLKDRESFLQSQIATLSNNFGNEDRRRLEELKIQLVNLSTRFSDEHPDVIKIRREIADMERQVSRARTGKDGMSESASFTLDFDNPAHVALSNQIASTGFEIESLNRQVNGLEQTAAQYRHRLQATPQVEQAYNALMGERQNTQAKYNDLMAKYMESQVAHGLEKERKGERFTIIDPARFPDRPVKPNRVVILLIGFVLAITSGVGVVAIREYADNSVRDINRLGRAFPLPVLAAIPCLETQEDKIRRRWRIAALCAGLFVLSASGFFAFHVFVMNLDALWTKIGARLNLFL
jgi:polysaccharide biosynthesis transport protein